MSNIFINRNRSQGAYKTPILKQKFYTTDQSWYQRADLAKRNTDTFYKKSLRYYANPDLSPNHVGMGWSIVDACDIVKPNQSQMREKYRLTENSMPLFKAFNQYENPKLTYNERMEQYPGPGSPVIHPSMRSNGFTEYQHSGGISKNDDLKDQIQDIASKIIRAKEMKGTLQLNNGMFNGCSWKTPKLDLALNARNGGETAVRFYNKFPIYRPRGPKAPAVTDNIQKIWDHQISLKQDEVKANVLLDSMYHTYTRDKNSDGVDVQSILGTNEYVKKESNHKRSNSNANAPMSQRQQKSSLNMAGRQQMFPTRERFNEDTESVIQEQKQKIQPQSLTAKVLGGKGGGPADTRSGVSQRSQALSKNDLSRFFKDKKKEIDEDAKSRMSQVSKASAFKSRFNTKKEEAKVPETVDYVDNELDMADIRDENAQREDDALTVATSAIDKVSVVGSQAATEQLAEEYRKLLDEYEEICKENQQMEQQVDTLKNKEK